MTERARIAARELERRGWQIESALVKSCPDCGFDISLTGYVRYCSQCGARVRSEFMEDGIHDLEAAIAKAIDGK